MPKNIKALLWEFAIGDITPIDFELWVYSNTELQKLLSNDTYLAIIMTDYKNEDQINTLKKNIYEPLVQFSEDCLCSPFSNNTRAHPFTERKDQLNFEKKIALLKVIMEIESFSGKPPIHQ